MSKRPRAKLRAVQKNGRFNRPNAKPVIARNWHARKAVEDLPPYIDSRSDNIALLGPNLAALRPYLKC